ncbi:MAG: EamA family transporter [Lentisphaeria bacterium]|nr:EamA family transporter [Lentisphaeria bacterium]
MLTGVLLTVAAGSFWSLSGVVNSCCAKYKLDIVTYLFSNVVFSFLLSLIFCFDYSVPPQRLAFTALIMIPSGMINTSGALLLQAALKRGHHGIIFLIANAAMVVPFLAGILFFGEWPSLLQLFGSFAIFAGIFCCSYPKLKSGDEKNNDTKWFRYALLTFLCFGISQTLMTMVSFPCFREYAIPGNSKTTLLYCGCSILMTLRSIDAVRKKELRFSKKLVLCGFLVSLCNLMSMYLMFYALDSLGKVGFASIGFSLASSTSLGMFTLYSIFVIKEKCYFMTILGLLFIVSGGLILSLPG